jgi:hypothetical protein
VEDDNDEVPIEEKGPRNLTNADVAAIVNLFNKQFEERFYRNVGKGIVKMAFHAALVIMAGFAAYDHFVTKAADSITKGH